MTPSLVRTSIWARMARRLEVWASVLDTDGHELTARRIDALEHRGEVIEAALRGIGPVDRDPA